LDPLERVRVGSTDLYITRLGLGGAALGGAYGQITDQDASATVEQALEMGIRYIDTAPLYGKGRSESRLGQYFATHEKPADLVLSTKVGRILPQEGGEDALEPLFDYTEQGVKKSFASSLKRLGPDVIDILYIHDADDHYQEAISQAYKAIAELRATGQVQAIGAGMNQWEMELRFAQEGEFDCFLQAGKYTLIDQSAADEFLPFCQGNSISVVIGAPFSYGVLAADLKHGARPSSRFVVPALVEKARKIDAVCGRHEVPLRAAALQFILAHPAIASVIPGARSHGEMQENFELIQFDIPDALWDDLKQERLIPETAPTP
jgi:D-threo-aldose 1-dehydrogenase